MPCSQNFSPTFAKTQRELIAKPDRVGKAQCLDTYVTFRLKPVNNVHLGVMKMILLVLHNHMTGMVKRSTGILHYINVFMHKVKSMYKFANTNVDFRVNLQRPTEMNYYHRTNLYRC